jgi:SAM-dependent methyltransferase
MRVLDVSSGAGDVAIAAARLVGPTGSVVGVDLNAEILGTARERAREAGLINVTFVNGDLREDLPLDGEFDAVVGRFVLTHLAEPGPALRRLVQHLRPGGLVAFAEVQFQATSYPPSPLLDRVMGWFREGIVHSGGNPSGGLALHRTFLEAGLPAPQMRAHGLVMSWSDSALVDYIVASVRTWLPRFVEYGVAAEEEVGLDTLEQRLRADFASEQKVVIGPLALGIDAWARKP